MTEFTELRKKQNSFCCISVTYTGLSPADLFQQVINTSSYSWNRTQLWTQQSSVTGGWLWPPWVADAHIIFSSCCFFLYLLLFFFA